MRQRTRPPVKHTRAPEGEGAAAEVSAGGGGGGEAAGPPSPRALASHVAGGGTTWPRAAGRGRSLFTTAPAPLRPAPPPSARGPPRGRGVSRPRCLLFVKVRASGRREKTPNNKTAPQTTLRKRSGVCPGGGGTHGSLVAHPPYVPAWPLGTAPAAAVRPLGRPGERRAPARRLTGPAAVGGRDGGCDSKRVCARGRGCPPRYFLFPE